MVTDVLSIERNIPIVPCRSIVLEFYEAIGIEATYRQKPPNALAAVRRGPIELQCFTMNSYDARTRTSARA